MIVCNTGPVKNLINVVKIRFGANLIFFLISSGDEVFGELNFKQ